MYPWLRRLPDFQELVDDNVFDVFSFRLKSSDSRVALSQPNNAIISESAAKRLFGDEDPVGKEIFLIKEYEKIPLHISGVMEDVPQNSHIRFDYLISYSTYSQILDENWYTDNWYASNTYVLVDPKANPENIETSISKLVENYIQLDTFTEYRLVLQALTEIYFNPTSDGNAQRGSIDATKMFLVLGLLILFIASLNFINLSTARAIKRSNEIGLRKVLGASRKQLIGQFLGESMLISFMAVILSIFLMELFIPVLNGFSNLMYQVHLNIDFINNWQFVLIISMTFLTVGLLSGLYPAFILSGYKPVSAFKQASGTSALGFRKALVIFQYSFSVVLIFMSLGLYKMFSHIKTQDMGFEKEHLVAFTIDQKESLERLSELKQEVARIETVKGVSATSKIPTSMRDDDLIYMIDPESNDLMRMPIIFIDEDYIGTVELNLLKIQPDLYLEIENRKDLCLANEAFIEKFGNQYNVGDNITYKAKAISKTDDKEDSYQIAGVINNFRHRDIIFPVGPALFVVDDRMSKYLMVRFSPGDHSESLSSIQEVFGDIIPDQFFEYMFVDDELNMFINIFSPFANLMFYGTFFAIMIASMGLFALALFTTQQRVKEIGIRKVFGSSELKLSVLLSSQFVKLVFIGFIISGPVSYWGLRYLLRQIPEKIDFDLSLFVGVAICIFFVSLLTVAGQSWRVASLNPANTLHNE
jgi:putative ABC transport system permease protein